MTTEHDLFEAVMQNPDDLVARLVFADWCDERGDPRGEFIRIQCELATPQDPSDENGALWQREGELLKEYVRKWNGEIHRRLADTPLRNRVHSRRGAIRRWRYRRGFVEYVVLEATALLRHSDALRQIGPINTLRIVKGANCIDQILKSPPLPTMKSVELVLPHLRYDQAEDEIAIRRPPELHHVEIRAVNCLPAAEGLGAAVVRPPRRLFTRLISLFQPK